MKQRILILAMISTVCLGVDSSLAFSAYENHLRTADVTHVALLAQAREGQVEALESALASLGEGRLAKALKRNGISQPAAYKRELSGDIWYMLYFDYSGEDYLEAVDSFEAATAAIDWEKGLLVPHPRAIRYGNAWLQMEWICFIGGAQTRKDASQRHAMVTTIKPEHEMDYRLYHQGVWPGVVDQMARGHNRNFSIFLAEIGERIYEFFYVEYCGDDPDSDGQLDKTDPANLRWWSCTDKCQNPLPGENGIWAAMTRVGTGDE